jgi:hypothetical protein
MQRFSKGVKNTEIFQSEEKYKDFSKWSCCNGRPARVENEKSFQSGEKYRDFSKWGKIQRFFKSGLVVMGDLPGLKMKRFQNGEKYKDFSKW